MQAKGVQPKVTIIIKALNEERRIAACLQAAVSEAQSVQGEVLLVDSLSTDRTVEIAQGFPIRIVQFLHVGDRNCGSAVQLGFQYTQAPYLYVLDADMILQPGFLATALSHLCADSGLAGVAGKLLDSRLLTVYDQRRAEKAVALTVPIEVGELGGGGLYRREAIDQVGYLGNRWLRAYEEAELGMRLRAAGWRLLRLPTPAVMHEGHFETSVAMLARLWRNGRATAAGVLVRGALGKPWFVRALRSQAHALAVPAMHISSALIGWLLLLDNGSWLAGYAAVWLGWFVLLCARKRSLGGGSWTLLLWHYSAITLLLGLFIPLRDPLLPIAARELVYENLDHAIQQRDSADEPTEDRSHTVGE
ncbi:glycosyltransferase [Duganella fentianensis]|uniref:glycosyltransferase n=1 Tax=Duganella fentianensis TaxID=2692177 RepID=UPI0032B16D5B